MQTLNLPCELYLVRHGETDWNAEGRLQGGRDIPLNDVGRHQAKEAAGRLRNLAVTYASLDFVCSPMQRARETMEILRATLGMAPQAYHVERTLSEITFGDWEGMTWREVRKADPARASSRERDKWGFVPPNGESYATLCERIRPWLAGLQRPTVTVSHGGIARATLALTGAVPPLEAANTDIWQGKILKIVGSRHEWV